MGREFPGCDRQAGSALLARRALSAVSAMSRVSALIAGSGLALAPIMVVQAGAPAEAQSRPADGPGSQAETGDSLEEIVVTARRREEVLQDVPQTVSAVTPTELQKLNLQNLQDISGVVPGLQIVSASDQAHDNDTLRGVTFNPTTGSQNTVAFYLNDAFVTNNFVTTSNFDVGQIEVLSGPQGTLRGEPAPSGSLTITTRRPDLEKFGGYVTATVTNLDNSNVNGAVNLPLIQDKLAVRLAGIANNDDFDGVRSINSPDSPYSHTDGGRASVRFQPIDSVEGEVVYQHVFSHRQSFPQVEGPGAAGGVNANAPANYNGPPITPSERLAVQTLPTTTYITTDIVTGQLDWHVLGQVLSYDGSYWKYKLNVGDAANAANQIPGVTAANPIPREPFQFDTPLSSQFTQTDELRIASDTPILGFMDYTAGFFYRNTRDEVDDEQLASFLPGSFGSPLVAPDPSIYDSKYTLGLLIQAPGEEKEYSEFVHFTFHLPHDTELTVGGRHLDYKKSGFTIGTLLPAGTFAAAALPASLCTSIGGINGQTYPGVCDIPGSVAIRNTSALPLTPAGEKDHALIYNVSLSHKLNQDLLVYVNSGSSWRPPSTAVGIFNAANDPELTSLIHVQTEKSYSFEGGFKWTFFDHRARLNAAFYHQHFNRFIYFGLPVVYLSDNGSGNPTASPFQFTSNPDAVVNGVDLDAGVRLTRQWTFDIASSYSNGHLTGSSIPCNPPNGGTTTAAFPPGTHVFLCPSNASVSTAPNFNFTAQTEYDHPVPGASGIDGFIRGLYTFYGRNPHASEFYVTPSFGLLNVYLGLRSADGAWEAALFAKNALNTQRILSEGFPAITQSTLSTTFGPSGYFNTQVTPRQEFGLTVNYAVGSR